MKWESIVDGAGRMYYRGRKGDLYTAQKVVEEPFVVLLEVQIRPEEVWIGRRLLADANAIEPLSPKEMLVLRKWRLREEEKMSNRCVRCGRKGLAEKSCVICWLPLCPDCDLLDPEEFTHVDCEDFSCVWENPETEGERHFACEDCGDPIFGPNSHLPADLTPRELEAYRERYYPKVICADGDTFATINGERISLDSYLMAR